MFFKNRIVKSGASEQSSNERALLEAFVANKPANLVKHSPGYLTCAFDFWKQ